MIKIYILPKDTEIKTNIANFDLMKHCILLSLDMPIVSVTHFVRDSGIAAPTLKMQTIVLKIILKVAREMLPFW